MRPLLFAAIAVCAWGQSDAPLSFDAASVKVNNSGAGDSHSHTRPANVQLDNMPLRSIVTMAYQIKDYELEAPDWLAAAHYDIIAKAAPETPEKDLPAMLRTLLAERFKLQTHRESKELAVYGMVAVKGGFKLKPVEAGGSSRDTTHTPMGGELTATKTSLDRLAVWLNRFTDRPVMNMTGIDGVFDFTLKYSIERENAKPEPNAVPQYPIVPLAIQEQLGLRLEKRTAKVDVLVVDHADRMPVEN